MTEKLLAGSGSQRCTMGVGCDEYGVCYASAHGRPDLCPAKAMEARQGQDPRGLDGDSHDSAVGNADLPNTSHAPEKE